MAFIKEDFFFICHIVVFIKEDIFLKAYFESQKLSWMIALGVLSNS